MKIAHIFQKYAFNLSEKKKAIEIEKTLHQAFKKKIRGFYDDIETNDLKLHKMKKELNNIKTSSIKESVYTNKNLPDQWKNKIGYHDNMFKIFSDDKNFLIYMGKGGNQRAFSNEEPRNNNSMAMNKTVSSFFPRIKKNNTIINMKHLGVKLEDKYNNKKKENTNSDEEQAKSIVDIIRHKFMPGKKKEESVKEIMTILEDYKTAFPIKIEKNNLLITEINETQNKEKETENERENETMKKIANKTFSNSLYKRDKNNLEINAFHNLDRMKLEDRQESYRQNIYTSLIPISSRTQSSKLKSRVKSNKKLKKIEESKYGPFLSSNIELFDKKVEINNPVLKKNLESINFYGPYYSYCPPCKSRNLEFYKNLDINKAKDIIHYIKNEKGLNIVGGQTNKNNFHKNIKTENDIHRVDRKSASIINEIEEDEFHSNTLSQF